MVFCSWILVTIFETIAYKIAKDNETFADPEEVQQLNSEKKNF